MVLAPKEDSGDQQVGQRADTSVESTRHGRPKQECGVMVRRPPEKPILLSHLHYRLVRFCALPEGASRGRSSTSC